MTTTKHIPAPWLCVYSPYRLQDDSELPAYEVWGAEKVCDLNENRPAEEQEANARLIILASEMLATLREAVTALNTVPRFRVPALDSDSYKIATKIDRLVARA